MAEQQQISLYLHMNKDVKEREYLSLATLNRAGENKGTLRVYKVTGDGPSVTLRDGTFGVVYDILDSTSKTYGLLFPPGTLKVMLSSLTRAVRNNQPRLDTRTPPQGGCRRV